jgi:NAD(P)-dependent dehydrogenase (short-subunit alcohol dehydrogenase family)
MSTTSAPVPTARILDGKTALVTGGTTGIGLAAARLLHAEGARLVITGHDPATLANARRELPDDVVVLRADVRDLADLAGLADELRKRFGGLDVAFLNAGVARFAPIEAIDEEHYALQMDTNVKGVLFTVKAILPLLRSGASIIVNTSIAAVLGIANSAVYAASKGAVAAAVRALATELAPRGIRVNAVSPGPIETPLYGKLGFPQEVLTGFATDMIAKVPLGRFGAAREVAGPVVFLASSASAYMTGAELTIDGGRVLT